MAQWPGDAHQNKVISTHEETLETAEKTVLETYIRQSWSLVHIWIDGQKTSVTPNHPYWVSGKGWVEAGKLTVSDMLRGSDGTTVIIEKIEAEELDEPITVYNFKVDEFHTYYVGETAVWVHNADCPIENGKITIEDIRNNPSKFSGKSANEIAQMLRDSGYDVTVQASTRSTSGAQIIKINNPGDGRNITQIQVSPGGGRHGPNPYIKISTSDQGLIKIVMG